MRNKEEIDIEEIKTSKLSFYYFRGNPRTNPMIRIIEALVTIRQHKKLTKPTLQLIYSFLLTGRKLQEAYEAAKDKKRGVYEPISVYVPTSDRYYTNDADRSVGYMMPNIQGVGRKKIDRVLSILGQTFDRSSFGHGGLGFFEIKQGSAYGTREGGRFRAITFRDPNNWPIWDMLNSQEEMFALWSGYESLTDPLRQRSHKVWQTFRTKYGAVVSDKTRDFDGDYVDDPTRNTRSWLEAAPSALQAQVHRINQSFPDELVKYRYVRTFRDDIYHGGRLNSIFTRMPKMVRNKIAVRMGLVEIDISNCAFSIFNIMATGNELEGDFYEKLATTYHENVKDNPDLYYTLPNPLPKTYRKVWKTLATRSAGARSDNNYLKTIQQFLVDIGCFYSKEVREGKLSDSKNYANEQRWREFCIEQSIPITDRVFFSTHDILKSLKSITSNSFGHMICSDNSLVFMNAESNALVRILLEMTSDGILPLGCHDAIFVPQKFKEKYEQLFPQFIFEEAKKRELVRIEMLELKDVSLHDDSIEWECIGA